MLKLKTLLVTLIASLLTVGSVLAIDISTSELRELLGGGEMLGGTTLKVPNGGTGATSFSAGECLVGNGTGAITTAACGGSATFEGVLNDISDVSTTSPTSYGHLLMWNGSAWTNKATSTLGITAAGALLNSQYFATTTLIGDPDITIDRTANKLTVARASNTLISFTTAYGNLQGSATDLACTDCINATEIEDIYVLTAGDTMTGVLNLTGASSTVGFTAPNFWGSLIGNVTGTASGNLVSGGTLTSANICQYDGSGIDCNLTKDGSGDCASGAVCLGDHTHSSYLTAVASDADWTVHGSYPNACATGVVTAIGDTLTCTATSSLGIVGGSDGQIQFNNGGVFGGSENLDWDEGDQELNVGMSMQYGATGIQYVSAGGGTSWAVYNDAGDPYMQLGYNQVSFGFDSVGARIGIGDGATTSAIYFNSQWGDYAFYNAYQDVNVALRTLNVTGNITIEFPNQSGTLALTSNLSPYLLRAYASTTYLTTVLSDATWTLHNSYPSACSAGQYVSAVGDTLTCSAPTGFLSSTASQDYGFTLTAKGLIATSSLAIPNGTAVYTTVDGWVAIDTTTGQFRYDGGTSGTSTLSGLKGACVTVASSTALAGTSTLAVMPYGITVYQYSAVADNGTSLDMRISDGTNFLTGPYYTATSTRHQYVPTANTTWTANEEIKLRLGTNTGVLRANYCFYYKIVPD